MQLDDPCTRVWCSISRFDGARLVSFDIKTMSMLPFEFSPSVVSCKANAAGVVVVVHRKHLPVSKAFGGAPFVIIVSAQDGKSAASLDAARQSHALYVHALTTPFFVCSKQRGKDKTPRMLTGCGADESVPLGTHEWTSAFAGATRDYVLKCDTSSAAPSSHTKTPTPTKTQTKPKPKTKTKTKANKKPVLASVSGTLACARGDACTESTHKRKRNELM